MIFGLSEGEWSIKYFFVYLLCWIECEVDSVIDPLAFRFAAQGQDGPAVVDGLRLSEKRNTSIRVLVDRPVVFLEPLDGRLCLFVRQGLLFDGRGFCGPAETKLSDPPHVTILNDIHAGDFPAQGTALGAACLPHAEALFLVFRQKRGDRAGLDVVLRVGGTGVIAIPALEPRTDDDSGRADALKIYAGDESFIHALIMHGKADCSGGVTSCLS